MVPGKLNDYSYSQLGGCGGADRRARDLGAAVFQPGVFTGMVAKALPAIGDITFPAGFAVAVVVYSVMFVRSAGAI